ncbi:MAG: hypothetical protein KDA81_10940 [Planctomycetaceae bacterium]|nr:hypothetical protein [Planctomycetaceae bacterium]
MAGDGFSSRKSSESHEASGSRKSSASDRSLSRADDDLFAEFDDTLRQLADPGGALRELGDSFLSPEDGYQPITRDKEFDADEEIRDYLGFMHRATEAHQLHKSASLITARVTDQLPNGLLPEIKKLVVPPDSSMFLFSERHAPVQLDPGKEYEVSRLGLGGGLGQSLEAFSENASTGAFQERSGVLICEVPQRTLPFTITLPDFYGFYPPGVGDQFSELVAAMRIGENDPAVRRQQKEELARRLGRVFEESRLKTQEGICTGVRAQLEIVVSNPQRLIETYCRNYARRLEKMYSDLDQRLRKVPTVPGLANKLRFPLKLLTQVCFGARQQNGVPLKPVSLAHIYKRIRLEVADALRDAIRQETARQLIEEPARVRDRVTVALEEHVRQSLSLYGADIRRIVSVECVSPEYNRMIIERGRLKLRVEQLDDELQRARIEEEEQRIQSLRFQDQVRHQNERKQYAVSQQAETTRQQLKELGSTRQIEDQVEAEAQRRRLQREAEEAAHLREERRRDAETEAAVQRQQELNALDMEERRQKLHQEKMSAVVNMNLKYERGQQELQQEALDREHQRQIERLTLEFRQQLESNAAEMQNRIGFLEKFAGLSANVEESKLLVMALASNPKLARPYVEATRARGQEELIAKMEDFRRELVDAHGKEDQLVHQLWQEGVRQIGNVLTKQSEKASTQVFAQNVKIDDEVP